MALIRVVTDRSEVTVYHTLRVKILEPFRHAKHLCGIVSAKELVSIFDAHDRHWGILRRGQEHQCRTVLAKRGHKRRRWQKSSTYPIDRLNIRVLKSKPDAGFAVDPLQKNVPWSEPLVYFEWRTLVALSRNTGSMCAPRNTLSAT